MAASMMTNKLIADLFPDTQGKHFMIDIGSGFDPLIDDDDRDGRRRLPWADPAKARPCYTNGCPQDHNGNYKAVLQELRDLVPDYASRSDDELTSALASW